MRLGHPLIFLELVDSLFELKLLSTRLKFLIKKLVGIFRTRIAGIKEFILSRALAKKSQILDKKI